MARRASALWWLEHYGKPCLGEDIVAINWYPNLPKVNQKRVHIGTEPLWRALGAIFVAYNYKIPTSYTGAYNCRPVTGGSSWSGHAWPLGMDINAKTNPYIRHKPIIRRIKWGIETDMPAPMIREIEQITASGIRAFNWGGNYRTIKDAMHFEVRVTLEEIAGGVHAPRGFYGDSMAYMKKEAQEFWQKVFEDLQKLEPDTNEAFARVLIEDFREEKAEEANE
jgi:hypothetical protein